MAETSQTDLPAPLVTVVIPCYNYADKVERAIDSVKAQTISNLECFIVDDGSTDDSADVIQKAIADDLRFHYIHQPNSGVANARNRGVFSGSAPYICCLDADDALDPQFLEACVGALEEDSAIGIAYTGLFYIRPDGSSGLSPWPGQYDYNKFLTGLNQIPTCNVSRRVIWERTGGQRQRYAPWGAGEEDAELWLRAGAYGFDARKVTDAGLFIYSWLSGRVSGNKEHRMVDYRTWHPWTKDGLHPFASMANPKRYSHAVRQYDEPLISVIIPVGPKHDETLVDALDSLEAQTFRNWEVIVGWDADKPIPDYYKKAYPYVRWATTVDKHGAGHARNIAAAMARSALLLFLDADDFLAPDAIDILINAYAAERVIVYSDYIGKTTIDRPTAEKYKERLLEYDDKHGIAIVRYNSAEFDCARAVRQPEVGENGYVYVWNLITSVVPKAWHDEIGGFDEEMPSWEDWDYWIRLAKAGKCFMRVEEPLVVYRFYTGGRRDRGLQVVPDLLQYLKEKYEGIKTMPCSSCPGGKKTYVAARGATVHPSVNPLPATGMNTMSERYSDQDFFLVSYDHPNRGSHRVVGPVTGIDYQYRSGGDRFLVHKDDIASLPNIFHKIEVAPISQAAIAPPEEIIPPPPPKSVTQPVVEEDFGFDLQTIPGVTPIIAQELNARGIYTAEDVVKYGVDNLVAHKGIGPSRAASIVRYAKKMTT